MKILVVCLTICLPVIAAISQETNRISDLPKITITREPPQPPPPLNEKALPNGMIRGAYLVPPTFLYTTEPGADPFGVAPPLKTPRPTAQEVLEKAGINFGEGSSAVYNPATSTLIVVQTPEEIAKVKNYIEFSVSPERNLVARVEIYELPALTALQAAESASRYGNHSPERNAILELSKQGHARLVNTLSIISRSGNQSRIEDGQKVLTFSGFENSKTGKVEDADIEAEVRSLYEEKTYGTLFEVAPVLGSDNLTVDLNFSIEHHTAPPGKVKRSINIPGTKEYREMEVLEFQSKKITSQITLLSGNYVLVGNWRPTGDPKYDGKDLMHLAFVHVQISLVKIARELE